MQGSSVWGLVQKLIRTASIASHMPVLLSGTSVMMCSILKWSVNKVALRLPNLFLINPNLPISSHLWFPLHVDSIVGRQIFFRHLESQLSHYIHATDSQGQYASLNGCVCETHNSSEAESNP